MSAFSLLVMLWMAAAQAAQNAGASVDGAVVEMGTNAPLRNVTLELRSSGQSPIRYPAVTTENGRFVFRNVRPGQYSLTAAKAGYIRAQYGQRGPNGTAATLSIQAGQRVTSIGLSMMRSAAISGRVYDRSGAPAVNAQLHAFKISYQNGWRLAVPVVSQMTNDLGEYRLFGLPPGVYYVSAQAEPLMHIRSPAYASMAPVAAGAVVLNGTAGMFSGVPDPALQRQGPRPDWSPVYYGGTMDEFAATPLLVRPGNDLTGIDVVVDRRPTVSITGAATGLTGQPGGAAAVVVTPAADPLFHALPEMTVLGGIMSMAPAMPSRTGPTGEFRMQPMPPGSYIFTAITAPGDQRLTGQTIVDLQGTEPVNVRITMSPAWNVQGRVVIENGPAAGDPGLEGLTVRAVSAINPFADVPAVPLSNDGGFALRNIARGNYIVAVAPLLELATPENPAKVPQAWRNAYIKSIRLGETDILNDGLKLDSSPERPLEIVIGRKGGVLAGAVADERGALAANVRVALLPDEARRKRFDLYRSTVTDANGRYRFDRIPPGAYKVFAWEDVELNAWHDAMFMRVYENSGRPVSFQEGAEAVVNLTAVSPLR